MVRGKWRPLATLAAAEDYSLRGSVETSDFKAAEDLYEDGNCVIVKNTEYYYDYLLSLSAA